MNLTHRERVRAVLSGEKPDRPVADLGGRVSSLSTPAYQALKAHLGYGYELNDETVTLLNTIGYFDERVLQHFDIPFRYLYLQPAATFKLEVSADGSYHDEWGVKFVPHGHYRERTGHPLAEATLDDLDTFHWPNPHDPGRVDGLAETARQLYQETDFALVAGHVSAGIFQDCWNLRGMEKFLMDMVINRDFAETLLDRVLAVHIGLWEAFLDAVGEYVEIVGTADDVAGQKNPIISPQMYKDLIKPRHAKLIAAIRERTNAKIFYHSDGALLPLLDDLLDTGVDILNPIQPLPGLMDPETLKEHYGDRLIFHGGLDVQTLLPTGTPDQVQNHINHYLDVLGAERYIMAPTNTVQADTPPENLVAAYSAIQNYAIP